MENVYTLRAGPDTLRFRKTDGALLSFVTERAPGQEFICHDDGDPVLALQYLDERGAYRYLDAHSADSITVVCEPDALEITCRHIGGMSLHAHMRVRASQEGVRWSLTLDNQAGLRVVDVQFPMIVLRYELDGLPGSETALYPMGTGRLVKGSRPQDWEPDSPHAWQLCYENGTNLHYPGLCFAQFLAYFNDRAGLLMHCEDAQGHIKVLKFVHHKRGLRMGVAHIGDWPSAGSRTLSYEVMLCGCEGGSWFAPAARYRTWSDRQPWAAQKLRERQDVPAWLHQSPPFLVVRIQGELDSGPAVPNEAFLPYRKVIPLLEAASKRLNSPVVPVLMAWEKHGPWIYPDSLPPIGGAESFAEFCTLAKARGWHVGVFCNGTRWSTKHFWTNYDGTDFFDAENGMETISRFPDGSPWLSNWDRGWRPSYLGCVGVERTNTIAADFVEGLVDMGVEMIQFLDQNGPASFPCFAKEHGHPDTPGLWMNDGMRALLQGFKAREKQGQYAYSCEGTTAEPLISQLPLCDMRVWATHDPAMAGEGFVPLFQFLYHEYILMQGGFGNAPEPYHMPIRSALNLVAGQIPGGVLTGDGMLLNYDTENWAPWQPYVGSSQDAFDMLKGTVKLRQADAAPWLTYGRMEAPTDVQGIETRRWMHQHVEHAFPAVYHSAWRDEAGRFACVLANWSDTAQTLLLSDARLTGQCTAVLSDASGIARLPLSGGTLVLPAHTCAIVHNA